MTLKSRRFRRLGALVLLLAWAPVATANAVTCGIWCEMNGGLSGHHESSMHDGHNHGGTQLAGGGGTVSAPNCGSPDLLVVAAVTPDAIDVPVLTVSAAEPPISSPISFVTADARSESPPPRA